MSKNILIVATSHDKMGDLDKPTGCWCAADASLPKTSAMHAHCTRQHSAPAVARRLKLTCGIFQRVYMRPVGQERRRAGAHVSIPLGPFLAVLPGPGLPVSHGGTQVTVQSQHLVC